MRGALPVAWRILLTLRGDRRTLGLVVVMPAFIIWLFGEVFPMAAPVAPVLLGVFVFVLTYILTAIGFLRERTAGTLERVLVSPISRTGLVVGYVLGFGVLATLQSLVLLGSGIYFLDVSFEHGVGLFFLVELLGAMTALGLGIVLSLFARNEFQVLQFMPTVIGPQIILGGTFLPVEQLPTYLEWPARLMPVTYLLEGMNYVVLDRGEPADLWLSIAALSAFTLLAVAVSWAVVRRAG
ncbi:MAG: ABC transporter permease [Halobacteriales archaeon]